VAVEITERYDVKTLSVTVLVLYCKSDALQVCQIPGDDQGASDKDLGDGVNEGTHVDDKED
jgi:hypothetical protein